MINPRIFVYGIGLALALSSCGSARSASTTDQTIDSSSDPLATSEARLAELERRIDQIANDFQPSGRGAYADGPALMVDQQGATSLLQRLHELQLELTEAVAAIADHRRTLAETRQRLATLQEENDELRGEIINLQHYKKSVEIVRDELADHKDRIQTLNQDLLASQRRRLAIERAYADFTRMVLELEPMRTQQLRDLQQAVRENIEGLWPDDAPGNQRDRFSDLRLGDQP